MRRLSRLLIGLAVVFVVGVVWASPQPQANLFQLFLLNTQADIETLADEVFSGARPSTWTQNNDLDSPMFVADMWFNNEQLASAVFTAEVRPPLWMGATSIDSEILSRNVRHDLELVADEVFGGARVRPDTWVGAQAIYRCERTLQNTVRILDKSYNVRPTSPESVVDYCGTVHNETFDTLIPSVLPNTSMDGQALSMLGGVRGDLERLIDELHGVGVRAAGWSGNRDPESLTFAVDLYADLESAADNELGTGNRPTGWTGSVQGSDLQTYYNFRYNVEALTELTLGSSRPNGWQSSSALDRCEMPLQMLGLLVGDTVAPITIPETLTDLETFCNEAEVSINQLAENPPVEEEDTTGERDDLMAKARYAFAYLDVSALQFMGIMPSDTEFRAWYRNFNESNMMFVSGENFALFIDRRWTTLSEQAFNRLPSLEGRKPLTFCDANWCNGPGPTPTPTGDSPLIILLAETTPEPTRDVTVLQDQGKQLVAWNSIRVNYLLDRLDTRTVQVTLEICVDQNQVACEPVTSVFDNTTGLQKPVVSQFNGLNVYEMPYGYSTNFIIEGATRFSRDVWISDATVRGG